MENFTSFLLFAIATAFTPGPNNIMIMASGANFGWRRSMPHVLGICFGGPLMIIAIGFGAGALFERFPEFHLSIKIIGLCYLIYFAFRIATASKNSFDSSPSQPLRFFEAALFQWINPKAWIMASSAIATYTTIGGGMVTQIGIIVLVFFALTWPSLGAWLFFGAKFKKILAKPFHQKLFNVSMALLLLVSMRDMVDFSEENVVVLLHQLCGGFV